MSFPSHRIPRLLVLAIPVLAAAYVLAVGPEKFYYESLGTLVLSPLIYLRLCPAFISVPARRFLLDHRWADLVLCGIPGALLLLAAILGFLAYRKNSLPMSLVALLLTILVFATYHFLQPLGLTVLPADLP